MLSKFKTSKGTCDYLTVGGVRVPSRNVVITITDADGTSRSAYISTKSKGSKGAHTTPSKLKKMLKNNPGITVTARVKIDEGSSHALTDAMSFDPSRCRGKDVDGTAAIDSAWSSAPDALWDVALKGVSYGNYKGNMRQMKWLIENGKSIEGLVNIILTPNTYSPHPCAEIVTTALVEYIEAGHSLPGSLGSMLTSDTMLLPPDAIKRAQALGYGNTMSPSMLRDGYSFLRDSALSSSVKESYLKQAAGVAAFAYSIDRSRDQAVLREVALNDSDKRARLAAVERVTDQAVLREVALNDSESKVRVHAVARMTDQITLSQIAISDSDAQVRKSAVGSISDQALLGEIVMNDSACGHACKVAISRLNDQAILSKIALNNSDPNVRFQVVPRLEHQVTLGQVALSDTDKDVRESAVNRLTDQITLSQIAISDSDAQVRESAVNRLTDQAILSQVVVNESDAQVRRSAARRVEDQALLSKLALHDLDKYVRTNAIYQLKDQATLGQILLSDTDKDVRKSAAYRLTDQAMLSQVVLNDPDDDIRAFVLLQLRDQTIIGKVALNDTSLEIRNKAVECLTDQVILNQVALHDTSSKVRATAKRRGDYREKTVQVTPHVADEIKRVRASAKAEQDAHIAAGICPICGGEPFKQILMNGNSGCSDCDSTGTARMYDKRFDRQFERDKAAKVYKYYPNDEYR